MCKFLIEKLNNIEDDVKTELINVWEGSVRATHTFLKESDIQTLIPVVKEGVSQIEDLFCTKDGHGHIKAFVGVENQKIEMLFVSPDVRGKGFGKELMLYAINKLNARFVDVNEQNPQAVGFYKHLGFKEFDRSELDDLNNPFPILHMRLK
jgi:putative acetyltransferase